MQCGSPGRSPLTLTLPSEMTVPTSVSSKDVLLNGKPAQSVAVHGSSIMIAIGKPRVPICDVIGPAHSRS
jgi:hypothetical protein